MDKIQGRVDTQKWREVKARLNAKTNQEAIEMLIASQLQRWALTDSNEFIREKLNKKKSQGEPHDD